MFDFSSPQFFNIVIPLIANNTITQNEWTNFINAICSKYVSIITQKGVAGLSVLVRNNQTNIKGLIPLANLAAGIETSKLTKQQVQNFHHQWNIQLQALLITKILRM